MTDEEQNELRWRNALAAVQSRAERAEARVAELERIVEQLRKELEKKR